MRCRFGASFLLFYRLLHWIAHYRLICINEIKEEHYGNKFSHSLPDMYTELRRLDKGKEERGCFLEDEDWEALLVLGCVML